MSVHQPPEPPAWLNPPTPPVYQRVDWAAPESAPRDRGPGPHDTVAASALLGLNFVVAAFGVATGALLTWVLREYYERVGLGYFNSVSVASAELWLVVGHIGIFVASAALTAFLMRRKRRSFFVPLVAALASILLFWLILLPVLFADHTLQNLA